MLFWKPWLSLKVKSWAKEILAEPVSLAKTVDHKQTTFRLSWVQARLASKWKYKIEYWNSYISKLFEASTLATKKYDPWLDSVNKDTSLEDSGKRFSKLCAFFMFTTFTSPKILTQYPQNQPTSTFSQWKIYRVWI